MLRARLPVLSYAIVRCKGRKILTVREIFHVVLRRRLGARTRVALKRSLALPPLAINEKAGTY